MSHLADALDNQLDELDLVLLRLTTVRLLMAAGKHHMVDRSLAELEAAFADFERSQSQVAHLVQTAGHANLADAIAAADRADVPLLERRAGRIKTLERDIRTAMAATSAAAAAGLREVTVDISGETPFVDRPGAGHRFLTRRN